VVEQRVSPLRRCAASVEMTEVGCGGGQEAGLSAPPLRGSGRDDRGGVRVGCLALFAGSIPCPGFCCAGRPGESTLCMESRVLSMQAAALSVRIF